MSGVLFRVDENTLDGLEKNLSVLREPERKAEVLANILQTLFYEIRESWKERDAARAELKAARVALKTISECDGEKRCPTCVGAALLALA